MSRRQELCEARLLLQDMLLSPIEQVSWRCGGNVREQHRTMFGVPAEPPRPLVGIALCEFPAGRPGRTPWTRARVEDRHVV
jgi:hypothetical protein